MSNSRQFEGKTAFLTGCNRGIGKEILGLLAENGANAICLLRKEYPDFVSYINRLKEDHGVSIRMIYADLSDEESIRTAFKPIMKEKPQIDFLINNAGIATGGFLQMTKISKLKEVFQINFFSLVLITQIVTRFMIRQRHGAIVNMGSVAGLDNFPGYTAYGSSKAAVMQFSKSIASELAPYHIRVNSIAPGLTDTGMSDQMEQKASEEMIARTDFKRLGMPQEIAHAVIFLLSEKASFITGQIIRVDGGM